MRVKTLLAIALVLIGGFAFSLSNAFVLGGGGSRDYAPNDAQSGTPTKFRLILNVWGGGGDIKGRYTNLGLYYKLIDEKEYKSVLPKPATLPDNYAKAMLEDKGSQWEAYESTIPAYPLGTKGTIQYYYTMSLDGHEQAINVKTIPLVSN
jgi:hypothetical protein